MFNRYFNFQMGIPPGVTGQGSWQLQPVVPWSYSAGSRAGSPGTPPQGSHQERLDQTLQEASQKDAQRFQEHEWWSSRDLYQNMSDDLPGTMARWLTPTRNECHKPLLATETKNWKTSLQMESSPREIPCKAFLESSPGKFAWKAVLESFLEKLSWKALMGSSHESPHGKPSW